jgi:hypothetical protein
VHRPACDAGVAQVRGVGLPGTCVTALCTVLNRCAIFGWSALFPNRHDYSATAMRVLSSVLGAHEDFEMVPTEVVRPLLELSSVAPTIAQDAVSLLFFRPKPLTIAEWRTAEDPLCTFPNSTHCCMWFNAIVPILLLQLGSARLESLALLDGPSVLAFHVYTNVGMSREETTGEVNSVDFQDYNKFKDDAKYVPWAEWNKLRLQYEAKGEALPENMLPDTQDDRKVPQMHDVLKACTEVLQKHGNRKTLSLEGGQWIHVFMQRMFDLTPRWSIYGRKAVHEFKVQDLVWIKDQDIVAPRKKPRKANGSAPQKRRKVNDTRVKIDGYTDCIRSKIFSMQESSLQTLECDLKKQIEARTTDAATVVAGVLLFHHLSKDIDKTPWGAWFFFFARDGQVAYLDAAQSALLQSMKEVQLHLQCALDPNVFYAFIKKGRL